MNHRAIRSVFTGTVYGPPVMGAAVLQPVRSRFAEPGRATPGKPQSRVVMRGSSTVASGEKATQPAAYSVEDADATLDLCAIAGADLRRAKVFVSAKTSPREVMKTLSAEQRLREAKPAAAAVQPPSNILQQVADEMKLKEAARGQRADQVLRGRH